VRSGDPLDDPGQIALHVEAKRQEVWQDYDPARARHGELSGRILEAGLAELEESGDNVWMPGFAGEFCGHGADGLVRRLDARAVSEDDDARGHEAVEM
jgi:hypothetical protein